MPKMIRRYMTDDEIRREGFDALVERLGPAGAIRFIQQYEQGSGDYTRDRGQWLDSITVEEAVDEMRRREGEEST
jgi:hypothetical protein